MDDAVLAERLAAALRFRTIAVNGELDVIETGSFEDLRHYLEDTFPRTHRQLHVERVGEADAILMQWQSGNSSSGLLPWLFVSHQDVVPVDDEELWRHPPFAGKVAEGHVWGRGALDLKVTMVAVLQAIENLLEEGFEPSRDIYLSFGGDEEIGGHAGAGAIATLLRGRGIRFAFTLDEGGLIIRDCFPGVDRPVALIGTAQKGFATLRMTAKAIGGHSAVPVDRGAIDRLARAVRRVGNCPMPARINGPTRELFQTLAGAARWPYSWLYRSHRLIEPLLCQLLRRSPEIDAALRTTVVATRIEGGVADNVVPQTASCILDCRLKPGESVADLAHHIRNTVNDNSIRLEVIRSHPASDVSSTDNAAYRAIAATLAEVVPEALVAPYVSLNDTDSKHFHGLADAQYRFVPVTLNRSDLARIHGTDERIAIRDYVRLVEFYLSLIRRLDAPAA